MVKYFCAAIAFAVLVSGACRAQAQKQQSLEIPNSKPKLEEVHYGNRVGGVVGQEGMTTQLICLGTKSRLQSIEVFCNNSIVTGFQMEIADINDDTVKSATFGNVTSAAQKKFTVEDGKRLVGISGSCGWFIDSIRFHFDDGTATPLYGGQGGDIDFSLLLKKDKQGNPKGRLMGFWGSSTDQLETIGLVFWPLEAPGNKEQ